MPMITCINEASILYFLAFQGSDTDTEKKYVSQIW